ncbi:unnamed protein product [Rotaria sp. Silwood1]|nr:unnamed protein product [Rotaria sp. Silwood1]CAF1006547.1 unnamed protein product [Rotaria sp. Silwood1]
MVEEALSNFGLFIDDENKIRLIDPERVTDSAELRDECKDFTDNVLEFKKIVDTLIEKTEEYAKQVEAARLKSIGAKNMLKSAAKYREFEKQQLQSLIKEKVVELERLRAEYESLQKTEREQNEKMEQLSLKAFIFVLLTTKFYCQNVTVQFQTFPVNTDIGSCTCDLTASKCDVSCCCDLDCTSYDQQAFSCTSRDNKYTNTTPILSTVQPSCYKNLSIFESNSPYIIQKMGELVCIDFQRYSGSQYYQQPNVQTLDPGSFVRTINRENSVSAPSGLSTNLTFYEVGTSILTYNMARQAPIYFSLPVKLFNNQLCSGSQSITYMNDFTSACSRLVTEGTCNGTLNPSTYMNPLCLIRSPAAPFDNSTYICDRTNIISANFAGGTCSSALKSLTIKIFYSNPTGIVNVTVTPVTDNPANGTTFEQTFIVQFIQNDSSSSSSSGVARNPGYLQSANLIVGIANGSAVDVSTTQTTCPNLYDLLMPINSTNLYVAAYSNSDQFNITTDWLPVISCVSEIGSPSNRLCQNGIKISPSVNGLCDVKLDIQIAYTKIGSISNPQSVLSAVIFHYQGRTVASTDPLSETLLVMESVTFQDISITSVTEQGQIPSPNARLPADFFYPFSTNQATKFMKYSLFHYLLISILFSLM